MSISKSCAIAGDFIEPDIVIAIWNSNGLFRTDIKEAVSAYNQSNIISSNRCNIPSTTPNTDRDKIGCEGSVAVPIQIINRVILFIPKEAIKRQALRPEEFVRFCEDEEGVGFAAA